jgi:DMSO reductase anchor subunit
MHPARSIILFTTSAGAGYGLLFLLALGWLAGLLPAERALGLTGVALALGLISLGLLASVFHLGRPERAWRALSQWRSSWLSREGVAALLTYPAALLLGLGWLLPGQPVALTALAALLAALGAFATVWCTGMIYASLQPIHQWHQPLTMPVYLGFALMTGALALHLLAAAFGVVPGWAGGAALAATALAFGLKLAWWRRLAKLPPPGTPESATGLGAFGLVRMLDPPHTQTNYLLSEMGYRIGRRHARALRRLAIGFGLFGSLLATLLALATGGWLAVGFTLLAAIAGGLGVTLERWLFFAEATHTVTLYYGTRPAAA